jgi:hypothetical protein
MPKPLLLEEERHPECAARIGTGNHDVDDLVLQSDGKPNSAEFVCTSSMAQCFPGTISVSTTGVLASELIEVPVPHDPCELHPGPHFLYIYAPCATRESIRVAGI